MTSNDAQPGEVLLVTGMSGAGKSSTLKILEDMGWETVDNMPQAMLGMLLDPVLKREEGVAAPLAVGIDTRSRGFDPRALEDEYLDRKEAYGATVRLCFLDADADVLQRRFTETRRRHPLAEDRTVMDGIRHERQLLDPLKDRADQVLDTSDVALPDLRRLLEARYLPHRPNGLQVFVTSFSFRRGLPREADLVFDVRFLRNPYYVAALKEQTGQDASVQAHIRTDPGWAEFEERMGGLLDFLTPRYGSEGKSYLTVAFGCTGGRHRSVYCTELFSERLRSAGHRVTVRHRDLGR